LRRKSDGRSGRAGDLDGAPRDQVQTGPQVAGFGHRATCFRHRGQSVALFPAGAHVVLLAKKGVKQEGTEGFLV
jgi:hypothetical protein